jgi:hypothetical protein
MTEHIIQSGETTVERIYKRFENPRNVADILRYVKLIDRSYWSSEDGLVSTRMVPGEVPKMKAYRLNFAGGYQHPEEVTIEMQHDTDSLKVLDSTGRTIFSHEREPWTDNSRPEIRFGLQPTEEQLRGHLLAFEHTKQAKVWLEFASQCFRYALHREYLYDDGQKRAALEEAYDVIIDARPPVTAVDAEQPAP